MSSVVPVQSQEQVKQLEIRRALDAEGWLSDVTILRKQLAAVDRKLHQMRLMDRLQVGHFEVVCRIACKQQCCNVWKPEFVHNANTMRSHATWSTCHENFLHGTF